MKKLLLPYTAALGLFAAAQSNADVIVSNAERLPKAFNQEDPQADPPVPSSPIITFTAGTSATGAWYGGGNGSKATGGNPGQFMQGSAFAAPDLAFVTLPAPVDGAEWTITYDFIGEQNWSGNNRIYVIGLESGATLSDEASLIGAGVTIINNTQLGAVASWKSYAPAAFTIPAGLSAVAIGITGNNDPAVFGLDNLNVTSPLSGGTSAPPTFSINSGNYSTNQSVALSSADAGATIYFTTDGSMPSDLSTPYTAPITLTSGSTTISAISYAPGLAPSTVVEATYTFVVTAPVSTPPAGTYAQAQTVTLSASPPDALIYYTTDDTSPTSESTLYTGPINIGTDTTLRAIALKADFETSPEVTRTYRIDPTLLAAWVGNNPTDEFTLPAFTSATGIQSGSLLARGPDFGPSGFNFGINRFDTQSGANPIDLEAAITAGTYATFTVTPNEGRKVSYSALSLYVFSLDDFTVGELLFSTDGFNTYTSAGTQLTTNSAAGVLGSFDVTGVAALQNVQTPVEFRCYFYGTGAFVGRGLGTGAGPQMIAVRGETSAIGGGIANFSSWAATNNVTGGPNGDSDNDGISNSLEYALNTNLTGSDGSLGAFTGGTLSFTKRADAIVNGDVTYIIETSPTLAEDSWTPQVTHDPGNTTNTITYTLPTGQGKIFGRLKILIQP